ncbi:MAG: T9SS type A sorting domain-containing protein [Lentimicrobiaceae bacterium]
MKKTILLFAFIIVALFLSAQNEVLRPAEVKKPAFFDVSRPLKEMTIPAGQRDRSWKDGVVKNKLNMPEYRNRPLPPASEKDFTLRQNTQGNRTSELLSSFDGVNNISGVLPPDTQGDVGLTHYMQMVNCAFAIYDKSGALVYGPVDNQTLWNGFPGPWSSCNDGDPVVIYDEQADRFIASQFAMPYYPNGPFYEMIAVSQSGDPTGQWYRYAYEFVDMPDYPKLGVWHDAYYLSVNNFLSGTLDWGGAGAAALERTKMLTGDPIASMIFFTTSPYADPSSFLPADCDGDVAPDGTPGLFAYIRDASDDRLVLYAMQVDWATPANSTFTRLASLPVASFSSDVPQIPQPGTDMTLQTLSDRLMYRLQYRNFGTYQAMVTNHTVNVADHAGVRWYEIRNTGSGWSVYQQGTYSPDNTSRWMGSLAMNSVGDIGLGFSVGSSSVYPSIRFTGRRPTDPLGEMTFAEQNMVTGGGSQTHTAERWGDYSMMSVDPANDNIFWYTQEYYLTGGSANWRTRIASFSLADPVSVTATAMPDSVCPGGSSQLSIVATGSPLTFSWTSNPPGFASPMPDPIVTPAETTVYTVTVTDGVSSANYDVTVAVKQVATINMAGDAQVCKNESANLFPAVTNADSVLWTTAGDGYFADTLEAVTTYYPGPLDLQNGSVTLTLTAFDHTTCGTVSAVHVVGITPDAVSNAGEDMIICADASAQLLGTADHYTHIVWETSGDGIFSSPSSLSTDYIPGTLDVQNGTVDLVLAATPANSCSVARDTAVLTIRQFPVANAGTEADTCSNRVFQLNGSASEYTSVLWTTSGDGLFSDSQALSTTYTPGIIDLQNLSVQFILTASNDVCYSDSDTLNAVLFPIPTANAGNDTLICAYSMAKLHGWVSYADSVQWTTSGNGFFENAHSLQTIYYPGTVDTTAGNVVLTLIAYGSPDCDNGMDDLAVAFSECLTSDPMEWNPNISVVPNPTHGLITVKISNINPAEKLIFNITDSYGKVLITQQFFNVKNGFTTQFDLSKHQKGLYFINMDNGTLRSGTKVILQ